MPFDPAVPDARTSVPDAGLVPDAVEVLDWVSRMGQVGAGGAVGEPGQAPLVDQLRALEVLKSAACAAQARLAVRLDEAVRRDEAASGVPARKRGSAVAAQVALARKESPHQGKIQLGTAKMLVREMPHTLAALAHGNLNEWRATVIVRETACLDVEDRARIDEQICGDPSLLEGKGTKQLAGEVRAAAMALDARAVVKRAAKAVEERTVTCRPAPDTMVYLSGLLPVAQGVAVYKALSQEADSRRAAGDERNRGQVMADTLVERVTGQSHAGAVKVELQVVLTDRTLFQGDAEPAQLVGYGVVPAQTVRDLVRYSPLSRPSRTANPGAAPEVWIRRLYTAPTTGQLMAMDSKARVFPDNMRRLIAARDLECRRSWCDAPIRHHDHVVPFVAGGATSMANAQGLCETCNYSKDAEGWFSEVAAVANGVRNTITTTTPSGHRYTSTAPAPPGTPPPPPGSPPSSPD